jgi:intergrase/recombinase
LKWSSAANNSMKAFKSIFDIESQGKGIDLMIRWIKDASSVLPHQYQNILLFNTLTGLRPNEVQKALHLVKTKETQYVDKERMTLKHYQFPSLFIRQTKNAYISIINEDVLEIAKDTPSQEYYYNFLRKKISITNNLEMNMYYCRKVFATYSQTSGIEPEIIDLLQGRISSSVFVNHYYRPNINEIITNKIRPVLDSLLKKLS